MKNKAISLLLVCAFVFTAFLGSGLNVNAKNDSFTNYTFKLEVTEEYLDSDNNGVINPATVDSTINKFGNKVNEKTWCFLRLPYSLCMV